MATSTCSAHSANHPGCLLSFHPFPLFSPFRSLLSSSLSMAPLAGRPPFATDEPDSFYESASVPQRRIPQPAPLNPNTRTSAYNVYVLCVLIA